MWGSIFQYNVYHVKRYIPIIGYWTNTVFWNRVLWSEFNHRACEVINPTKERGPKTMYKFNNRIIIYMYLYKIINFIKYHHIYVGLLIIIKCFEHQFIPKHRIRIDIALFACSRSDIEVAKRHMLDICMTSQPYTKRACNKQACNKRLYGTIASHDEVWQFYEGPKGGGGGGSVYGFTKKIKPIYGLRKIIDSHLRFTKIIRKYIGISWFSLRKHVIWSSMIMCDPGRWPALYRGGRGGGGRKRGYNLDS